MPRPLAPRQLPDDPRLRRGVAGGSPSGASSASCPPSSGRRRGEPLGRRRARRARRRAARDRSGRRRPSCRGGGRAPRARSRRAARRARCRRATWRRGRSAAARSSSAGELLRRRASRPRSRCLPSVAPQRPSRAATAIGPSARSAIVPLRGLDLDLVGDGADRDRPRQLVLEALDHDPQLELGARPRAAGCGRSPSPSAPRGRARSRCRHCIVASCFEMRASSACSVRFCLRFAPEISSTLSSTASSEPNSCSSCGGGLVPDPRDAGDVVRGVALEPDQVGDQLGRDAVALDDAVAVVDLACR